MSLFKSEYIFVSRKDLKKKNSVRGPVLSSFSEKSPLKTFFAFLFKAKIESGGLIITRIQSFSKSLYEA